MSLLIWFNNFSFLFIFILIYHTNTDNFPNPIKYVCIGKHDFSFSILILKNESFKKTVFCKKKENKTLFWVSIKDEEEKNAGINWISYVHKEKRSCDFTFEITIETKNSVFFSQLKIDPNTYQSITMVRVCNDLCKNLKICSFLLQICWIYKKNFAPYLRFISIAIVILVKVKKKTQNFFSLSSFWWVFIFPPTNSDFTAYADTQNKRLSTKTQTS